MGDDYQVFGGPRECASGGCPAVVTLPDERTSRPDTEFEAQWQYYVYAINKGMSLNAIIALMGSGKALFNTGKGIPPRRNALTGNMGNGIWPRLDKLRTFGLNTHALKNLGNDTLQLLTMDGNNYPLLKAGKSYPRNLSQVNPDDYFYMPQTHRWLFLDCTNVKLKLGGKLDYGPFAHGLIRDWIGDNTPHSFFPLVSKYTNICPAREWNLVTGEFPSPFRQS